MATEAATTVRRSEFMMIKLLAVARSRSGIGIALGPCPATRAEVLLKSAAIFDLLSFLVDARGHESPTRERMAVVAKRCPQGGGGARHFDRT